jgi:hypothetical protein
MLSLDLRHARFSQARGLAKGSSGSAECLSAHRANSSSREFWLRQSDSPIRALNSDEHRRRLRPRLRFGLREVHPDINRFDFRTRMPSGVRRASQVDPGGACERVFAGCDRSPEDANWPVEKTPSGRSRRRRRLAHSSSSRVRGSELGSVMARADLLDASS